MSEKNWFVAVGGQQQGPFSREEIAAGIQAGRYGRDAYVFGPGMANWLPVQSDPGFAAAFGGGAVAAPPQAPAARAQAHEIDYELFGEDMQYVEVTLDPGEACIAEAGAFMYMDPGIQMETIFGDGNEKAGLLGKLMGATVIAAASTDAKLKVCAQYGADHLLNYTEEAIKDTVLGLTGEKGADVIFDPVGGDATLQALRCINRYGRLLIIGFASGIIADIPANRLLLRQCQAVGVQLHAEGRGRVPAVRNSRAINARRAFLSP